MVLRSHYEQIKNYRHEIWLVNDIIFLQNLTKSMQYLYFCLKMGLNTFYNAYVRHKISNFGT